MLPLPRLYTALVLFFAFLTFSVHAVDEEEPNDEFEQAQQVNVGELIDGFGTPYDVDYYSFEVSGYGALSITVLELTDAQVTSLALYSANEYLLENIASGIDPEASVNRFCVAPATYYVRVQNGPGANGAYGLDIQFYPSDVTISEMPYNSNNTQDEASTLAISEGSTSVLDALGFDDMSQNAGASRDKDDWMLMILNEPGHLDYENFSYENLNGNVTTNASLRSKNNLTLTFAGINECLLPDSVYLYMSDGAIDGAQEVCSDYSIDITWDPIDGEFSDAPPFNDDFLIAAKEVPEGETSVHGSLGYTKDENGAFVTDTDDWWKYTLPESGILEVYATFSAPVEGTLQVFDPDSSFYPGASFDNTLPYNWVWFRECNSAGTEFLIKVHRTFACGPYELSFNVVPSQAEPDPSGNDSFEDATGIFPDEPQEGQLGYFDECGDDCIDHEDYYTFDLDHNGDFSITYEKTQGFYPGHTLYRYVDKEFVQVTPNSIDEDLPGLEDMKLYSYDCMEDIGYWIKVTDAPNGFNCRGYKFIVEELLNADQYAEADEDPDFQATELPEGQNTGAIGFSEMDEVDSIDNWYIETEESGKVTIDFIVHENLDVTGLDLNTTFNIFNALDENITENGEILIGDESINWTLPCVAKNTLVKIRITASDCGWYDLNYSLQRAVHSSNDFDTSSNNSFQDAVAISQESDVDGQVGFNYECGINCTDPSDYFKFEWTKFGSLEIPIFQEESTLLGGASIKVFRQNSLGEFVEATSSTSYPSEEEEEESDVDRTIHLNCKAPQEFWIQILKGNTCDSYSFQVNDVRSFATSLDPNEPNNTFATAEILGLNNTLPRLLGMEFEIEGSLVDDDFDFYAVVLPSAGHLVVEVQTEWGLIDQFQVYEYLGESWTAIGGEDLGGQQSTARDTVTCLSPQTYLIGVARNLESEYCGAYTIKAIHQPLQDDFEPNDNESQAAALNTGQVANGTVRYQAEEYDITDFYKFTGQGNEHTIFINGIDYTLEGLAELNVYYSGQLQYTATFEPLGGFTYGLTDDVNGLEVFAEVGAPPLSQLACYQYNIQISGITNGGDINGDGIVSSQDILALLSQMGCTENCGSGDVNGDGVINTADLLIVLSQFGA